MKNYKDLTDKEKAKILDKLVRDATAITEGREINKLSLLSIRYQREVQLSAINFLLALKSGLKSIS